MEIALTIVAGFGALLILIGYLGYVVAGFKHHFVTGIIATLPVLNIVTIPALWYTAAKKIMISLLGIIILATSWFFGADKSISSTLAQLQGKKGQSTVALNSTRSPLNLNNVTNINPTTTISPPTSSTVSMPPQTASTSSNPYIEKQREINEEKTIPLPPKALYFMSFELIPLNNILSLKGRTIQLTIKNNQRYEGRVMTVSNTSIVLQSRSANANEIPTANIKEVRLMVKKAN